MEEIARDAGVAKPTLYKYFPEKSALYETLVQRFIADVKRSVDAALAKPGAAKVRIAAALTVKKKYTFRLLNASPHAHELYDDDPEVPKVSVLAFERYVEDEITRVLDTDGFEGPRYLAQLLIACAEGIAKRAQFAEQIGPAIRHVTEKLLA
jgi:AcrR family transcriptional regulator